MITDMRGSLSLALIYSVTVAVFQTPAYLYIVLLELFEPEYLSFANDIIYGKGETMRYDHLVPLHMKTPTPETRIFGTSSYYDISQ